MGEWDTSFVGSRVRAVGTKTFEFERPPDLDYAPGQFFFVMLRSVGVAPIEHHFSFSSSPTEPTVEFTTRMTGSEFKTRVDALKPGESVHIAGPEGVFVPGPEMNKIAFVCGGIGITPARSTLRWILDSRAPIDIVVLYAERNLASCAFAEEFATLDTNGPRVVTVLSHPEPGWGGRTGHIDADLVREEVPDWAERDFFVSGPGPMVDGLVRVLIEEVGVPEARVKSEHFPGYAGTTDSGPATE